MPLVFTGPLVKFEDVCAVEDAMGLVEHLRLFETPKVDLSDCTYLHTALLQLLLLVRPLVVAPPRDAFLLRWFPTLDDQGDCERRSGAKAMISTVSKGGT